MDHSEPAQEVSAEVPAQTAAEQERTAVNAEERSRGEAGLLHWESYLAVKIRLPSAGYTPLAVLVIYDCMMSRESPFH